MSIQFTQIPDELLVPGQYQEIDNSAAGSVGDIKKVLILGMKTQTGAAPAGAVVAISSESNARAQLGEGSPAAVMAQNFLALNKTDKLYALPLAELVAGVKAVKSLTFTGPATEDGTFTRYVNGRKVAIAVAKNDAAAAIAASFVAACNSLRDMEVDASVDGVTPEKVLLTSLVKGLAGNQTTVVAGIYGEKDPSGVTATFANSVTGTGNPDVSDVLAAIGETRYHYIITDLADTANLVALSAELTSRYSGTRQIDGRLFLALSGEDGDESTEGSLIAQAAGINSPHIVLIPRGINPQTPGVWGARFAAALVRRLADDPAANTTDTEIAGLIVTQERTASDRETLLKAGIATYRASTTGVALIERVVTSYTTNTDGDRDTSYLDVQVVETISAIRAYINSTARTRYKTWKLASTSENFGSGSKVMTPELWKGFLVELYQQVFIQEKQWCQDLEGYKNTILTEVDADGKTRLNWSHKPTLIGQFYIGAGLTQFD